MQPSPAWLEACGFKKHGKSWIKRQGEYGNCIRVEWNPLIVWVCNENNWISIQQPTCECIRSAWYALTGERLDYRGSDADETAVMVGLDYLTDGSMPHVADRIRADLEELRVLRAERELRERMLCDRDGREVANSDVPDGTIIYACPRCGSQDTEASWCLAESHTGNMTGGQLRVPFGISLGGGARLARSGVIRAEVYDSLPETLQRQFTRERGEHVIYRCGRCGQTRDHAGDGEPDECGFGGATCHFYPELDNSNHSGNVPRRD